MFVLVDGNPLQTPARDRGIGRYTAALIAGLKSVRPSWQVRVIEHTRLEPIPEEMLSGCPVCPFSAPLPYDLHVPANRAVNDRFYADWVRSQRPDHVLLSSIFEKLGSVPRFCGERPPMSAVMYDLIPVLFPVEYGTLNPSESWYARRVRDLAGVDVLYAISEAAATDARRLLGPLPERVVNIQGAVDPKFVPLPADQLGAVSGVVRQKYGIHRPFVLYVGGYDYRKNLPGALAGFAALPPTIRDEYQLVIACHLPDWLRDDTRRTGERLGIGESVVTTGFVSDEELRVLYQTCRCLFFPSFYEGLGLPVLEALRCGAPVVCSDLSSLPEFAGNMSWLCDPHDPQSMATQLAAALTEPYQDRESERVLFSSSFSWEKTAEGVATEIERCRPRPRPPALRVAWVTDELPQDSPREPDSVELVEALSQWFEIEFVSPQTGSATHLARSFRLVAPEEVESRHDAAPFDLFVWNLRNGVSSDLASVMARHRGLLLLNCDDLTAYPEERLWRMLHRSAAVVVRSAADRQYVRRLSDTPAVAIPHRPGSRACHRVAAGLLAAVIRDTVERLATADQVWIDAAANAIAAVPGELPVDVIQEWSGLRARARSISCDNRIAPAHDFVK